MLKLSTLSVLILSLSAGSAAIAAETGTALKLPKSIPPGKLAPRASASAGNPCAGYGPGFARVDGTETCIKVGGAIRVDVGTSR